MLKINDITIKRLKSGDLKLDLPEFYELNNTIENNPPWHAHENVFDHTLSVLMQLENQLKRKDNRLQEYLSQKLGYNYTIGELLWLAGVFHDIAKPETTKVDGEKITCPGHEEEGAEKADRIIKEKFDLSDKERERIISIIKLHGVFSVAYEENPRERFIQLRSEYGDILRDLMLLEIADTKGCYVTEEGKLEQKKMIDFYEEQIESF